MPQVYEVKCLDDKTRFRLQRYDIGLALRFGSYAVIMEEEERL